MSDSFFGKYRGMVLNNIDPMQQGRLQVQVPDVAGLLQFRRQHEITKDVTACGRQRERPAHAQDEVGFAQLPAFGETGQGREVRRIPLGHSAAHPFPQGGNLGIGQTRRSGEIAMAGLGHPRGHVAVAGCLKDLGTVVPRIGERQQRERRSLAWPVAGGAMREQDRRHILIERNAA